MAKKEIEKILKEEDDYLYTDSETGIGRKSKTDRVMDESTGKLRRKTIGPQQVWYTDEEGNSKFKRIRGDDQRENRTDELGARSDKAGNQISKGFSSLVGEKARDTVIGGGAGMLTDVVGGILGGAVSMIGNVPRTFDDISSYGNYSDVKRGWKDLKEAADKNIKQGKEQNPNMNKGQQASNWVSGWVSAIDDLRQTQADGSDNLSAELMYEFLNSPFDLGIGKAFKAGSKVLRNIGKVDDVMRTTSKVVGKVDNIADDVAKEGTKLFPRKTTAEIGEEIFEGGVKHADDATKGAEHIDDVTRTDKVFSSRFDDVAEGGSKTINLVDNAAEGGTSYIDELLKTLEKTSDEVVTNTSKNQNILSKIGNWISKGWKGDGHSLKYVLGPIKDVWDIGASGAKVFKNTLKSQGVGSAVVKGLTETVASSFDLAGNFFGKPLSYRVPAVWEADTANKITGEIFAENIQSYIDDKNFLDYYGYDLRDVQMKNDEQLKDYYEKNNIPSDKQLTADQIKEVKENLGSNKITDLTRGRSNILQLTNLWSTPAEFQSLQNGEQLEVERNSRGEPIGFERIELSDGITIDTDGEDGTVTIKDKDGNEINPEDLTQDQMNEIIMKYAELYGDTEEENNGPIPQGGDDNKDNQLLTQLNTWATKGMVNSEHAQMVADSENTRGHADSMLFDINETSKQYWNTIISMYTPEQIEKDILLQKELIKYGKVYEKFFNNIAEVISKTDSEVLGSEKDVYYFEKAMTQARDMLTADEKKIMDDNLYQKSIDYNNGLESTGDRGLMRFATSTKRFLDDVVGIFKSEDREYWYDQGLAGLAQTTVDPTVKTWGTMFNKIRTSGEDDAAYLITMFVGNKINDGLIEKYTEKGINNLMKNNPRLNTKFGNYMKGFVREMASEPMENFMDQISVVNSPDHDYKYWQGLIFGMIQGGISGYAGAKDSYTSIHSYYSDPKNRNAILENMGIYIDLIEDPQQRATALAITNQLFDNIVDIMADTAAKTNNGVEALMQGYAIYQIENMAADYTTDIIGQAVDLINNRNIANGGQRSSQDILDFFASEKDFQNYNNGKGFKFSQKFVTTLTNNEGNKQKLENLRNTANAYIHASLKTAGMSLEDGINYIAPKVYQSTGGKVITPIFNKKISDNMVVNELTGEKYHDLLTIYAGTNTIPPTVGQKLGITKDNPKVYGEKKSKLPFKTSPKKGFKNKISVDRYDSNGKKIRTDELSMKDYLIELINTNERGLTNEERKFITTILFKTTVSGLNPYFKDDGSLTRLGEDFFEQVIPQLSNTNATTMFFYKMSQIQTLKEAKSEKSERDALKKSGANNMNVDSLTLEGGEGLLDGTNIASYSDDQKILIEKNGTNITIGELKNKEVIEAYSDNTKYTFQIEKKGDAQILRIFSEIVTDPYAPNQQEQAELAEIDRKADDLVQEAADIEDKINTQPDVDPAKGKERLNEINQELDDLQKQRADVENRMNTNVYSVKEGGVTTTTVNDNNVHTRETNIPVSADAKDYPEIEEGKFEDAVTLMGKYDLVKKDIPFLDQTKVTVGIEVDNKIEDLKASKKDITISSNDINKKEYRETLPDVEVMYDDGTGILKPKTYKAVWVGDRDITDDNSRMVGKTKNFFFKSFVLVDFKGGERVNKYTNKVLRPREAPQDQVFYGDNNVVVEVIGKDGKPLNENRSLMFTWGAKKGSTAGVWRLASTIQLDRLGKADVNNAFDNNRVFMNEWYDPKNTPKEGYMGRKKITYDPRPIYTTSDVVFAPENRIIRIGGVSVNVSGKSYSEKDLQGLGNDMESIQSYLNKIWKKGQTIRSDGSFVEKTSSTKEENEQKINEVVETVDTNTQERTSKEVKNDLNAVNQTVENQYNYGVEKAESKEVPATESVAETALNNVSPVQQGLFGGPTLDSIKDNVIAHINGLIDNVTHKRDMENELDDIEDDIKDLQDELEESEDKESIQKDIDDLEAKKVELESKLEDIEKIESTADELEFDSAEEYLDSILDEVDNGNTNTIMNYADKYGLLKDLQIGQKPQQVQLQKSDKIYYDDFGHYLKSDRLTKEQSENLEEDEFGLNTYDKSAIKGIIGNDDFDGLGKMQTAKRDTLISEGKVPDSFVYTLSVNDNGKYIYVASTNIADYDEALKRMDEGYFSNKYRKGLLSTDINKLEKADRPEVLTYKGIKQVRDKLLNLQQQSYEALPQNNNISQKNSNDQEDYVNDLALSSIKQAKNILQKSNIEDKDNYIKVLDYREKNLNRGISSNIIAGKALGNLQVQRDPELIINDIRMMVHGNLLGYKANVSNELLNIIPEYEGTKENQEMSQAEKNASENTTVESMPEPTKLLAQTSAPNTEIASRHLTTQGSIDQLAKDCDMLGIVLDTLTADQLAIVIEAYKNGKGIDYVIEQFANKLLTSQVDQRLVQIFIKKGILREDMTYDGLTISQMINYTATRNSIEKENIEKMVNPDFLQNYGEYNVINEISNYYIQNYFHYNPQTVSKKFRNKVREMVKQKLIDSNIHIVERGNNVLNQGDDTDALLQLEKIEPELRIAFANAAYNYYENSAGRREWKPLISQSRYNYLMGSNPYVVSVGDDTYNPGIIAASILDSMNTIPEFGEITSKTANKNKLNLVVDIYNYFQNAKSASTYSGLIKFLRKKYSRGPKEMKAMIDILEADQKATENPIHSDTIMNLFWKPSVQYENSPYENFVKDKGNNTDAIIEALIVEERVDPESFAMIIKHAPSEVRRPIYNQFFQENKENHGKNLAYGLVASMITNNNEVEQGLAREHNNAGFGDMSDDALYILRNFDRNSLISPIVTQQLHKELGLNNLNTNIGTVVLTDNGQNTLGRGMKNFQNTKGFQMLSVSNLDKLQLNVNVIVPSGLTVPKKIRDNKSFNIIAMPEAGYKDGALVVKTYDGTEYNMANRVYNILGMAGLGIQYTKSANLTDQEKDIILENKGNKSLYWNIFKYNILPNLGPAAQDLTQETFEQFIDTKKLDKISKTALFNTFVARDLDELFDASVRVINYATNGKLGLVSNKDDGRHGLMLNKTIEQFTNFVANTFDTSTQREAVLKMFADYVMMQLAIGQVDRGQWFSDFCERHASAIISLSRVYRDRSQQGAGLSDVFINKSNTIVSVQKRDEEKNLELRQAQVDRANEKIAELEAAGDTTSGVYQDRVRVRDENQKYVDAIKSGNFSDIALEEYEDGEITDLEDYQAMQEGQIGIEEKDQSTVVTQSYETEGAYDDNAIKVLSAIFQDYIEPNMTSELDNGKVANDRLRGVRLVSKGLLNIITGETTFYNENEFENADDFINQEVNTDQSGNYVFSNNRKTDITNKDLVVLQGMLMTLKETNPTKLQEILDSIIITQDELGYEYESYQNQKLKRLKRELFDKPSHFYQIIKELISDTELGVDVYYDVTFDKSTKYKGIQLKGLLNSIAQEYYKTRPVTVPSNEIGKLHEEYDRYFNITDAMGTKLKPSDEQINAFMNLKDRFDNRSAGGTLSIPGIAGTGKTTLLTALFNYIMEQGGAQQEVTNIAGGKQTVFVHNFMREESDKLWKIKGDNKTHYMEIKNPKSGESVYISFQGSSIISHEKLANSYKKNPEKYMDRLGKAYGGMWNVDGLKAITEVGEDEYISKFSKYTMMINNFKVVNKADIPQGVFVMQIPGNQGELKARPGQTFEPISNNAKGLDDVSFAVRMHSTVGSLKDVFINQGGLAGLDIATLDSYLEQDSPTLMKNIGYSTSYHIRDGKKSEGRMIIIDEAQNSYNTHLQALVDGLSKNNVIIFLGDYHQMSKGDFLANQDGKLYMTETHRGTEDINLINDISSFSQGALTKANAIGLYMSDSEDFVMYDPKDVSSLVTKDIRKTLMVCHTNQSRKDMNKIYLETLGGTDSLVKKGATIQAMIVDIESDAKTQRNRKSELLNDGLNLKGFTKSKFGNWYFRKNKSGGYDLFFPETDTTDTSDPVIESALKTIHQPGWKANGDIAIFVPAFAITTEKESGKTVDNIILHEDITNTDYDFLSSQNVKQYYDAFTRGSKKVYLPNNSTRLIGITREQAQNLRDGNGLTAAVVNVEKDTSSTDRINIPAINNGKWNSANAVNKMMGLLTYIKEELKIEGIDDAINELRDIYDIMASVYLQLGQTTTDAEAVEKHGIGRDVNSIASYQKTLQYQAAEIWDKIYNRINKKELYNKFGTDEKFMKNMFYVNGKVYGQTIKTPTVEGTGQELLYGQKKYINRKLDLELVNDIKMQEALIGEGSLTEGKLLIPVTKQYANGTFYTTLKSAKVIWNAVSKSGRLNYNEDSIKKERILADRERRLSSIFTVDQELNNIFNENNYGTEEIFNNAEKYLNGIKIRNPLLKSMRELVETCNNIISEGDPDMLGELYDSIKNLTILNNADIYLADMEMIIDTYDATTVKSMLDSTIEEDVYVKSAIQELLESCDDIVEEGDPEMINDLQYLMEDLSRYVADLESGISVGMIQSEMDFNGSSIIDTIDSEFTCK